MTRKYNVDTICKKFTEVKLIVRLSAVAWLMIMLRQVVIVQK